VGGGKHPGAASFPALKKLLFEALHALQSARMIFGPSHGEEQRSGRDRRPVGNRVRKGRVAISLVLAASGIGNSAIRAQSGAERRRLAHAARQEPTATPSLKPKTALTANTRQDR